MFLLRAVLNILVRNASPRGPMCFRCQCCVLHDLPFVNSGRGAGIITSL